MSRAVPRRTVERDETGELGVATMARSLVERARRCSFSSLVAWGHDDSSLDPSLGDAAADDEVQPDPSEAPDPPGLDADDTADQGHFAGLRGTTFGTVVHEALEAAFTRRGDELFDDALAVGLGRACGRHGVEPRGDVFDGLLAAASTRIGDAASLRELRSGDAAAELRFSLPVADGVALGDVAGTLLAHKGAGPFADWASRLADSPERRPLASSLVGSVDLVSTLGTDRYWVVDYKTNVVVDGDFGRDGLLEAMRSADYPLQALLYLVALHRLLRWRHDG
jgi:exodeoxyribonuclease V beta subunit